MIESAPTYRYGDLRFWEMLPGGLVWGTFLLSILLSFIAPLWVIIYIIVFDVLWLFRVIYFVIYLFIAWRNYRRTSSIAWSQRLAEIPRAQEIYHLVFLPTYQEEVDIVRQTLRSLADSSYPHERFMVVLAGEQADEAHFKEVASTMTKEFGHQFKRMFITIHPTGLPDEIPGKGSNLHWSGLQVADLLCADYPEIQDEQIVASAFDVDTVAHAEYFAYLTYLYCTVPDPLHASYQPVALFSNNIWTATSPVRVASFGTTFWILGELARPERLWTFSSHSMPWKMLKDVGFWEKGIVSEDSRIFMQAFVHYHGQYRVEPMFLPVSMDAVSDRSYVASLKALYRQIRRWAWGVEHLPYLIQSFRADLKIPLRLKLKYIFNHIEGMYTWATAPILMFVLGWLPLHVASSSGNAIVQAAPFTLEQVMRVAMVGLFVSAILSLVLLPPRPKTVHASTWFLMVLQWALLPVTFILFGSIPAIDAQTRLMFGHYLGFNVTKKGERHHSRSA